MSLTEVQMAGELQAVDPTVRALTQRAAGHLPDEARFRFEIALSEALTNLVLHAVPAMGGPIDLALTLAPGRAQIALFDPMGAAPFDLRDHAPDLSDVDALAEGGRGLGLILHCADAVDYGPEAGRNRLLLTFHARPRD